jgi:hypothetical protein
MKGYNMATEEEKKKTMFRMTSMMISGMAKALYDLFGDSALAAMNVVGENLLAIMENEMGLEISGEDPKDILTEIGRLYQDEFGLVESFTLDGDEKELHFTIKKCKLWKLSRKVLETGVDMPFTCPILNVGQAAMMQKSKRSHRKIDSSQEECTISYTFVS